MSCAASLTFSYPLSRGRGHSENCVPILCPIVGDIYKYALHCNPMAYWRGQYRETDCNRFPVNFNGLEPPARKILLDRKRLMKAQACRASIAYNNIVRFSQDCLRSILAGLNLFAKFSVTERTADQLVNYPTHFEWSAILGSNNVNNVLEMCVSHSIFNRKHKHSHSQHFNDVLFATTLQLLMLNLARSRDNVVKISPRIDRRFRATIDALQVCPCEK